MTAADQRRALPGSLPFGRDCFACGPDNPVGMHLPYEVVGDAVEAVFNLDKRFSGAPRFVHGGLVMTVLDEAMAWAAIAIRGRFAVTTDFTATFDRPVLIGEQHTVRATAGPIGSDGRTLVITATITRGDSKICARAQGTYRALTDDQAQSATGLTQTLDLS